MPDPTDTYLQKLAALFDNEDIQGITLSGSYARGEAGPFSDLDLWLYVRQEPAGEFGMPRLEYIDGYLVSTYKTTLEKEYSSLRNPEYAIWCIAGLSQARILLDKDGAITNLKATALNLNLELLQPAADLFASRRLAATAEEVYKILDGLAKGDESKTLYAIWSLTQDLATTLLVQHGTLIPTENKFIDLAQATAGRTSSWTHQFRLATGLDSLPTGKPVFIGIGTAGLGLFRETASFLRSILKPEDARIIDRTIEVMTKAGY
jgi:hypothetical protein